MKKLLLIITLIFCGMMSFAQKTVDIEVKVVNDNGEPMQNVSVRNDDGYLLGISDWRGELKLRSVKTGDVMNFSHVAYHEMEYKITEDDIKNKFFTVKMFMKLYELPEVTIVENVPHVAYDNKVVSVADYEMNKQGIYLLAHRMRNYSLLHLSYDFDTLAEIELPRKFDHFYKDVYDQIHVLSQDSAYWVGSMKRGDEYAGMVLTMGIRIEQFLYIHAHVSAATDQVIITHLYTNRGQELYYFDIGENEEKKIDTTVLEHIRWEEGCMLMENVRKFGPMGWRGKDAVALAQNKFAIGNDCFTVAQNNANEHSCAHDAIQVRECHVAQAASLLNSQFCQFGAPPHKGFARQKTGILDQSFKLSGGILLGVKGQRNTKRIAHSVCLVKIFGVTDTCDGMNARIEGARGHAAKQVELVGCRYGNEQVGVFNSRLRKGGMSRSVSYNSPDVKL